MIRISRPDLGPELSLRLRTRTDRLKVADADHRAARREWSGAALEKEGVRLTLRQMSAAVERCMYCGDSRGTDIDHFEPIR